MNMSDIIYGLNIKKEITPIKVRDAIKKCFLAAHRDILDSLKEYDLLKSEKEFRAMKDLDVTLLIKKFFEDSGGDYDAPTKESLKKVVDMLSDYACKFRKPEIVKKHKELIMKAVNCLK